MHIDANVNAGLQLRARQPSRRFGKAHYVIEIRNFGLVVRHVRFVAGPEQ